MKKKLITLSIAWLSIFTATQAQEKYFPDPDPLIQQRLEEWRDLKFGLLMHWGTYSQWGIVEKLEYLPRRCGMGSMGTKERHY